MIDILQTLRSLLVKYGYGDVDSPASYVDYLISLRESGNSDFYKELTSINIWGGAGSITDINLNTQAQNISNVESYDDNLMFRQGIVSLAEQMEREGIGTDRARDIASVFKEWNEKGL